MGLKCSVCGRTGGHEYWCWNKPLKTNHFKNISNNFIEDKDDDYLKDSRDKRMKCTTCGGSGRILTKKRCIMCGGSGRNLLCYLVPDPLEDHFDDKVGRPRFPCKSCNGEGEIEVESTCFNCFGEGYK